LAKAANHFISSGKSAKKKPQTRGPAAKVDREETPDRAGCVAKRSNKSKIRCAAQNTRAKSTPGRESFANFFYIIDFIVFFKFNPILRCTHANLHGALSSFPLRQTLPKKVRTGTSGQIASPL
jgi:hypothetical protein